MADLQTVDYFFASHASKLPMENLPMLRSRMYEMPDERVRMLTDTTPFKDPIMMLAISFAVGVLGVDRIMLDQTGLGVLKLLTGGGCGVWAVIDWFMIMNETKKYNLNLLMNTM